MPAANTSPVVKGLRFLKNTKSYLALSSQMMWAIWFLMFLLPIIYLVLSASYAHKKKTAAAKSNARSRAKEKLKKARQLFNQGDKRSAGIEIVNAVMGALAQVAKVGGVAMTAQELTTMIPQLPQEKKDEILSFLARCELVSFAPEVASQNSNAQDNNLLPEAEKVIAGLLDLL
jgi:hypothetical protein